MENYTNEIRLMLDKAKEEEVLSTIVMILEYYISKYDRDLGSTMTLIKKGYKKYVELLKGGDLSA